MGKKKGGSDKVRGGGKEAPPQKQPPTSSSGVSVWLIAAIPVLIAVAFMTLSSTAVNGSDGQFDGAGSIPAAGTGGSRRALGGWTEGYYSDPIIADDGSPPPPPSTHAVLYDNGGEGEPELKSFISDREFESLGRVYNDHGQIVASRRHFVNGTTLYRGPSRPGAHFQWPSVRVGLKRTVPGLLGGDGRPVELETLTDPKDGSDPRVFYVHNFLSPEEARTLIDFSTSEQNPYKMAVSTAGTHKAWNQGGDQATMSTRTSMNAFDLATPESYAVKRRAFRLLRLGEYNERMADGIQVLRYEVGQAYIAHHDYFPVGQSNDHNWDPSNGGSNRFATIFLYLSDVEYGGQTVFPNTNRLTPDTSADLVRRLGEAPSHEKLSELTNNAHLNQNSWEADLIQQCYAKFAVPPRQGDAILFYSQRPNGQLDPSSLHGACPVLTGQKWGANLWVWNACRYSQCTVDPLHPAEELSKDLKAPFNG